MGLQNGEWREKLEKNLIARVSPFRASDTNTMTKESNSRYTVHSHFEFELVYVSVVILYS